MIYMCEDRKLIEREFTRLGFDRDGRWRISDINKDYQLCNTYPRFLIIPSSFKDEDLEAVAKFRYFRRIPVAVWRHFKNGCFIARTSQPTVGWFGWFRGDMDELLIQQFVINTIPLAHSDIHNKPPLSKPDTLELIEATPTTDTTIVTTPSNTTKTTTLNQSGNGTPTTTFQISELDQKQSKEDQQQNNNDIDSDINENSESDTSSKIIIIDARSYTAAMANRAKGGGCEHSEYYQRCEIQFMDLANIHSIRKSFQYVKSAYETYNGDDTTWLHHISALIKSALLIVDTLDIERKSILIHCSDGWDRTPQLVALSQIMLDPELRTFEGFKSLVKREWIDFGHKFADRCGSNPCNPDLNERCPVFLQWLDCVQQMTLQYPSHFEFNSSYLDKMNRHTNSNVFATFSHNCNPERISSKVADKHPSLWDYFEITKKRYTNDKYRPNQDIIRPSYKLRDLHFWLDLYKPNRSAMDKMFAENLQLTSTS